MRTIDSAARLAIFAWIGVMTFVVIPPSGAAPTVIQAIGYPVAGAGLAGWMALERHSDWLRPRPWLAPLVLGGTAIASGAAAAASSGGGLMVIVTFMAALVAASETTLAVALAVTTAGVLAVEVTGLALSAGYGTLAGLPVVVAAGLLTGMNRAAYRVQAQQAAQLLAQREELAAEHRRADLLAERARIAREIHDVLAHSLGALSIQIQTARAVLTDSGDIGQAADILARAQRISAEGLTETRRAVHALRTDTLPLAGELAAARDTFAREHGVLASFDATGTPADLGPDATVALLRVAQEALVNAAKHAAGQHVAIRLDYGQQEVALTISNPLPAGAGNRAPRPGGSADGGYGLTGMSERLRLQGGTLHAGPRQARWVVTARLPLVRPPAAPPITPPVTPPVPPQPAVAAGRTEP